MPGTRQKFASRNGTWARNVHGDKGNACLEALPAISKGEGRQVAYLSLRNRCVPLEQGGFLFRGRKQDYIFGYAVRLECTPRPKGSVLLAERPSLKK
jgi:hypothetical protein